MGQFAYNAAQILDTAEALMRSHPDPSDVTILIGAEGGLRIISNSDWPLASLQAVHGAEMAYRVRHYGDRVCVDGRSASQACRFDAVSSERARLLLRPALPPTYEVRATSRAAGVRS